MSYDFTSNPYLLGLPRSRTCTPGLAGRHPRLVEPRRRDDRVPSETRAVTSAAARRGARDVQHLVRDATSSVALLRRHRDLVRRVLVPARPVLEQVADGVEPEP
jgi:hypothetical protein